MGGAPCHIQEDLGGQQGFWQVAGLTYAPSPSREGRGLIYWKKPAPTNPQIPYQHIRRKRADLGQWGICSGRRPF